LLSLLSRDYSLHFLHRIAIMVVLQLSIDIIRLRNFVAQLKPHLVTLALMGNWGLNRLLLDVLSVQFLHLSLFTASKIRLIILT